MPLAGVMVVCSTSRFLLNGCMSKYSFGHGIRLLSHRTAGLAGAFVARFGLSFGAFTGSLGVLAVHDNTIAPRAA